MKQTLEKLHYGSVFRHNVHKKCNYKFSTNQNTNITIMKTTIIDLQARTEKPSGIF